MQLDHPDEAPSEAPSEQRNTRKNSFESYTRNVTLANLYEEWLNQENAHIPRKFKAKKIAGESEEETDLKKKLSIERVRIEINILRKRVENIERKYLRIDEEIFADKMRDIWLKESNADIESIKKKWEEKKEWFISTKQEAEQRSSEENNSNQQ